jgi:light-regulated signal transduction histidine kinase (bacteriophytochrome)
LINLKADDLIGKPLFSIIPDAEEYYRPLLEKVRQTGEPLFLSDSPYSVDTNGQTTSGFLHVVYQPYRNAEGTILGVMAILQDVTEQVKAVQRLKESESRLRNLSEKLEEEVELRTRELKQSNEDLQQFAHVASHDLKEPVRKIKTFAGRLQDELGDALGSRGAVYLQKVQQATSRMVSMIDGVLAYSSINATRLAPEEIDLNTVLENIKTDLEVVIQQRGAQVLYDDLPRLQGAPVLIYQLFYNLINNSIKFTQPDCPAIVKVESAIVSHEGKKAARISVRDNGIGFDEKYARNIFHTFTRLNSKDKYEGTGLGLALCKKIVERHDGSIDASSIKSEGATFTITLPLRQTHEI